ncbi:MAG: hypothetical protein M3N17_00175 [Actinomycetota bacterium]|nr:hypothetical protein [Actinomycetota bacterium]
MANGRAQSLRVPLEEAKRRFDAGEAVMLDVTDRFKYADVPDQVARSLRIDPMWLDQLHTRLPAGKAVLAYCT